MQTQTQLTKKETNLPAVTDIWTGDNVTSADIQVPSILLIQASNKLVTTGLANPGEIIDSSSKEVLAKKGGFIEFFLVMADTEWHRVQMDEKKEWRRVTTVAYPPGGGGTKWSTPETLEGGTPTRYTKSLRAFVGLVGKLDYSPFLLTLRGMSTGAAMTLTNHIFFKTKSKKIFADTIFKATAGPKEYQGRVQLAYDIVVSRASTEEELKKATEWRMMLKESKDRVISEEEETPF